jgi:hypothetical protein
MQGIVQADYKPGIKKAQAQALSLVTFRASDYNTRKAENTARMKRTDGE